VAIVLKSGSLNLLEPSGPVQACNGIALLVYIKVPQVFCSFDTFFIKACDAVCVSSTRANPLRLDHRDGAWRRLPVICFRAYGFSSARYFSQPISRCVYGRDLWEHSVLIFLLTTLEINVSRSSPYEVSTNLYNSCGILSLILLFQFPITFVAGRYLLQCTVRACSKRTSAFVCFLQCGKSCLESYIWGQCRHIW